MHNVNIKSPLLLIYVIAICEAQYLHSISQKKVLIFGISAMTRVGTPDIRNRKDAITVRLETGQSRKRRRAGVNAAEVAT